MDDRESPSAANFDVHIQKLLDLYVGCQFSELCCQELLQSSLNVERAVRWSTAMLIGCSLLTGSISYLNQPIFAPIWAIVTTLATMVGIYSLIVGSGARQQQWFAVASELRKHAQEVAFVSEYLRLGRMGEDELLERWRQLSRVLNNIRDSGGAELADYALKNQYRVDFELAFRTGSERTICLQPGASYIRPHRTRRPPKRRHPGD